MRFSNMSHNDRRFIDVFELARTGQQVDGHRPLASLPRLAPMLAGVSGDLRFQYRGHLDARRRSAGTLQIDAEVPLRCDRCGATLTLPVTVRSTFYFVHTEAELARIPVDDSEDEPLLGNRRFDLDELIEDELILACPISPRHADCHSDLPSEAGAPAASAETVADQDRGATETRKPFAALVGFKPRRH
jgi:uncharacterized protein